MMRLDDVEPTVQYSYPQWAATGTGIEHGLATPADLAASVTMFIPITTEWRPGLAERAADARSRWFLPLRYRRHRHC
jgi:hypothetical protein